MNVADIRHLFDYTEWANARVLDAAENLSDEALRHDFGISYRSIFGTLVHMAGAEWIWLERWNGRSPGKEAWTLWSTDECRDLATLNERWADIIDRRTRYIADLDDERFDAEMSFKLISGDASSLRLAGQMQHVVNHATLHRGQVVGMIRQLALEPPSTDLLFYLRSDISPK